MKCIIVIRGLDDIDYLNLRNDMRTQLQDRGVDAIDLPLFASLPDESASIEIVWLDPAMELEHLKLINANLDTTWQKVVDDYNVAIGLQS